MSFLIDDKLLEKYNRILDKISHNIKKEFDSAPVETKTNTFVHNGKITKEAFNLCLLLVWTNSEKDKNYHSQIFLECKH